MLLKLCVVFIDRCLSLFVLSAIILSFLLDLRFPITTVVSSNCSYMCMYVKYIRQVTYAKTIIFRP